MKSAYDKIAEGLREATLSLHSNDGIHEVTIMLDDRAKAEAVFEMFNRAHARFPKTMKRLGQ
jgi:hypothetical protein